MNDPRENEIEEQIGIYNRDSTNSVVTFQTHQTGDTFGDIGSVAPSHAGFPVNQKGVLEPQKSREDSIQSLNIKDFQRNQFSKTTLYVIIAICFCCCALPLVVVLFLLGEESDSTSSTESKVLPSSTTELRAGNDHIGLLFTEEPLEEIKDIFSQVVDRWSRIVSGTSVVGNNITKGSDLCSFLPFSNTFFLDHLMIIIEISSQDGVGGSLALSGPCAFDPSQTSELPLVGIMIIDSDDIDSLEQDNSFKTLLLHEMAHVLGIGSLWPFATTGAEIKSPFEVVRNDSILVNPILDPLTDDIIDLQRRPVYTGDNAVFEFNKFGSLDNIVPVEDGRGSGVDEDDVPNIVDAHWKFSVFGDELMVFAIKADNPISIVTIGSLKDLGYVVDFTLADFYVLPPVALSLSKKYSEDSPLPLHFVGNDIYKVKV